jgi:hypothetical protein
MNAAPCERWFLDAGASHEPEEPVVVLKPGVQPVLDDVARQETSHGHRYVEARYPPPGHRKRIDHRHTSSVVEEPLRRSEASEARAEHQHPHQ